MKNVAPLAVIGLAVMAAVIAATSCTPLGGPPLNVMIGAETDTTVLITWSTPAEGTADAYLVYFKGVRDSGYTLLADTIGTSLAHNPHGATGMYKVTAKFGNSTYDSKDTTTTTVPAHNDTMVLYELNADSSKSGYGWDTLTGEATVYSMAQVTNAAGVDFYPSDLGPGRGRLPYVVISPDQALIKDSGATNIVPGAGWHKNGFGNLIGSGDENQPVPGYDSMPPNYFVFSELSQMPALVPVYTNYDKLEDRRHYALLKFHSVDTLTGRVVVESWYQRVPRLRLIQH